MIKWLLIYLYYLLAFSGAILFVLLVLSGHWLAWWFVALYAAIFLVSVVLGVAMLLGKPWAHTLWRWLFMAD